MADYGEKLVMDNMQTIKGLVWGIMNKLRIPNRDYEDCLQEALLLIYKKAYAYNPEKKFSNFAHSVIKNGLIDVYRRNTVATKRSTLHAPTLRAVMAYIKLSKAFTDGDSLDNLGAIGKAGDKRFVAEYISGRGEIQGVVYNQDGGNLIAGVFENETSAPANFKHKAAGGDATGTAMFFAAMPALMQDEEFKKYYDVLYDEYASGFTDINKYSEAGYILCDNVYRRVNNPDDCGAAGVKIEFPASGNVRLLSQLALDKGSYSPSEVLLGQFKVVKAGLKPKTRKTKISNADFVGKYAFSERFFNEKEQALIPEIPSWYVIPEQVATICDFANKTTGTQMPMRNFMLRGAAGSGKTEGAKAIAAGLGLPYMFLTCSADDEKFDFVGQILPNIEGIDFAQPEECEYTPTIEEIEEDPTTAYYNMPGEFVKEMTAEKVKQALEERIKEKEKKKEEKKDGKDFRYVYTPLIEAIKNGYLIELQEPTVISKQGVLVGLNSLLDNCKAIQLVTGEVIHRHPDTVIVITTNTDYNGCREMNQSIISRMNLIFDMNTPNAKVMTERVMGITGCKEKSIVKKMAEAVEAIAKRCQSDMISDGSCGMRELISWVQSYMICEDVLEAAEYTILSSVSAYEENREVIRSKCLLPLFETA